MKSKVETHSFPWVPNTYIIIHAQYNYKPYKTDNFRFFQTIISKIFENFAKNVLFFPFRALSPPPHPKINAAKVSKLTYASVVDVGKSICT